jgi:hypothetical protein
MSTSWDTLRKVGEGSFGAGGGAAAAGATASAKASDAAAAITLLLRLKPLLPTRTAAYVPRAARPPPRSGQRFSVILRLGLRTPVEFFTRPLTITVTDSAFASALRALELSGGIGCAPCPLERAGARCGRPRFAAGAVEGPGHAKLDRDAV